MDTDIHGNAALVTASSSGLGKGAARALVREGANVVVNGRDESRLESTVAELDAEGDGDVVGVQGDLSDPDVPKRLIERTVDEFGGLDHLVTNAGGPPHGAFMETDDDDWYEAYDLLVMSTVRLIREAEPHLRESDNGTVVNITSISVKEAIDSLVLSNSVRMSLIGLEKTLSNELAPDVRINAILPGTHETERVEEAIQHHIEAGDLDNYEEGVEARVTNIPLNRMGDPIELGELAAFLSSPRSGFITGEVVRIDGGASHSNL